MDQDNHDMWKRAKTAWPYAALVVAVCAFFAPDLFLGQTTMMRDTFADFIPKLTCARQAYRGGEFPLWNRFTGCGHPFIADPYTGSLYPPNLLFVALPVSWAQRLALVLHVSLAGCGMIALARLWGLRRATALLAGIAFALSTTLVAMLEFHNILFPVAWGPLIMFLGFRLLSKTSDSPPAEETGIAALTLQRWPLICGNAVALALCYLAGNPQYVLFPVAAVFGFGMCNAILLRDYAHTTRALGLFCIAGLLSLMLCAPQILPFLELLEHSIRSGAIDAGIAGTSVHPFHILTMLFPMAAGTPGGTSAYWGRSVFQFWLGTAYVGVVPLLAALLALPGLGRNETTPAGREYRCRVIFCLCGIAAGAALAAGSYLPFYGLAHRWIPGFDRVRWPSRFLLWVTTFVPLLGAIGVDALWKEHGRGAFSRRGLQITVVCAGAVMVIGAAAAVWPSLARSAMAVYTGAEVVSPSKAALLQAECRRVTPIVAVVLAAIVALALARNDRSGAGPVAALLAVLVTDLLLVGYRIQPRSDVDVYQCDPTSLNDLRHHVTKDGPGRVLSVYGQNQYHLYGVDDPTVYELARAVGVGDTLGQSGIESAWRSSLSLSRYSHIYDLLPTANNQTAMGLLRTMNVRAAITGPPWLELVTSPDRPAWRMVDVPNALPRALLVSAWRPIDSFAEGLRLLSDGSIDPGREALIEPSTETTLPPEANVRDPGIVEHVVYSQNGVSMHAQAKHACLLVLNDTWFPGWEAEVNGVPTPIIRANLLYRAITVPAGNSDVVFRYAPRPWRLGKAVFLVACVVMGMLVWLSWRRRGREAVPSRRQDRSGTDAGQSAERTP